MAKDSDLSDRQLESGSNSFLIDIHYHDHSTWQGTLQWLETGQKIHFRSELEMLHLIQQAVNENASLRTWKDSITLKAVK